MWLLIVSRLDELILGPTRITYKPTFHVKRAYNVILIDSDLQIETDQIRLSCK